MATECGRARGLVRFLARGQWCHEVRAWNEMPKAPMPCEIAMHCAMRAWKDAWPLYLWHRCRVILHVALPDLVMLFGDSMATRCSGKALGFAP